MVCAVMDFAMSKYCSKLLQYFMNSQKLIQLSKLGFDSDRMLLCPSSQLIEEAPGVLEGVRTFPKTVRGNA